MSKNPFISIFWHGVYLPPPFWTMSTNILVFFGRYPLSVINWQWYAYTYQHWDVINRGLYRTLVTTTTNSKGKWYTVIFFDYTGRLGKCYLLIIVSCTEVQVFLPDHLIVIRTYNCQYVYTDVIHKYKIIFIRIRG